MTPDHPCQDKTPALPTTVHVRRARDGDAGSLGWLVRRFTPYLSSQAAHHLRRFGCDPDLESELLDELLQEVWAVACFRIGDVRVRDGRVTPVFVRFLAGILSRKLLEEMRKRNGAPVVASDFGDSWLGLQDGTRSVITRVLQGEREDELRAAIDAMSAADAELIVLRGIEGHPYGDIADLLGRPAASLRMQYRRALDRLAERLPTSLLDGLDDGRAW